MIFILSTKGTWNWLAVPPVTMSWDRATVSPVRTSMAAWRRFSGVIVFAAPSTSSLPQRPQFDNSCIHLSSCASVTRFSPGFCAGACCARVPIDVTTTTASVVVREARKARPRRLDFMSTSVRLSSGLLRSDPEIPPVHWRALDLEDDVSGFLDGMFGHGADERAVQECFDRAVLRDDLHG